MKRVKDKIIPQIVSNLNMSRDVRTLTINLITNWRWHNVGRQVQTKLSELEQ